MNITKGERLYIRVSAEQKAKLDRAARAARSSRSQFVLQQALEAADRVLAEDNKFVLSQEDWQAFCERLDAPARDLPNVRRLAKEPTPFDAR